MNERNELLAVYLNELDRHAPAMINACVLASEAMPWVRKYAWVSRGSAITSAVEDLRDKDVLCFAVRNLSAVRIRVEFECKARKGRVRFDGQDESGILRASLVSLPSVSGRPPIVDVGFPLNLSRNGDSDAVLMVAAMTYLDVGESFQDSDKLRFRIAGTVDR